MNRYLTIADLFEQAVSALNAARADGTLNETIYQDRLAYLKSRYAGAADSSEQRSVCIMILALCQRRILS